MTLRLNLIVLPVLLLPFLNLNGGKQHHRVTKSLRNNHNLVITKPDKDAGVVLLDHSDYILKMDSILNDTSKFLKLGPVEPIIVLLL